ncbi:MAG: HNH endonuclease signature motif containing protein [Cumulibacter sp.]
MQVLVADGHTGEVLHLGRERRFASKAQRRAMMARDETCRFPGCVRAVRLHAHHLQPWSLGGATDIDAMILLCQHHHVLVHAASITITTNKQSGGYTFTRVGGQQITAQHRDQYSSDRIPRSLPETQLVDRLIDDTTLIEEPMTVHRTWDRADPTRIDADRDWDLPVTMQPVQECTDFHPNDQNVYPKRCGGETHRKRLLRPSRTPPADRADQSQRSILKSRLGRQRILSRHRPHLALQAFPRERLHVGRGIGQRR